MNVLHFAPEVAQSCLEMAIALSLAADGDVNLLRTAAFVHRCYARALESSPGTRTHELRWRRFITALAAYAGHCAASPQSARLQTIVRENEDLLERDRVLAAS